MCILSFQILFKLDSLYMITRLSILSNLLFNVRFIAKCIRDSVAIDPA